jgi:hypothetical protein
MNLLSEVPVCRAQVHKKYNSLQTGVTQISPVWGGGGGAEKLYLKKAKDQTLN